jgi:hypothetical protein
MISSRPGAGLAVAIAAVAALLSCAAPVTVKPPPADVSRCRDCHAGDNKDYPQAANVYRFWETSGHGRFANRSRFPSDCPSCHDLQGAAAGHLDGKKNVGTANPNHLVAGYLKADPVRECDVQIAFDEYCWTACHKPLGVTDMRHERDADPAKGAVLMGQHGTYEKAKQDYPMDSDISVAKAALAGPPYCAPCVSCHDPHGTGATSLTGVSNKMSRDNFKSPSLLCSRCHR